MSSPSSSIPPVNMDNVKKQFENIYLDIMSRLEEIIYQPEKGPHPLQHEIDKIIEDTTTKGKNVDHMIYDGEVTAEAKAAVLETEERHVAVYIAMWEAILMLEMSLKTGSIMKDKKIAIDLGTLRKIAEDHFKRTMNHMRATGQLDF